MDVQVNYVALLLASVASMVIGFLWYSPMLFGKTWSKLMGYTAESMKKAQSEMGKWYLLSYVVALVTAFVLSHVMTLSENYYSYDRLMTGVTSAFWMWLGFVMPVQFTDVIFGKRNWTLFGINTGFQLASLLAMGVVLALL